MQKVFLSFAIVVFLISCENADVAPTIPNELINIATISIDEYDSLGNYLGTDIYHYQHDQQVLSTQSFYNTKSQFENGLMVREDYEIKGRFSYAHLYEYDEQGRIILKSLISQTGDGDTVTLYTCDYISEYQIHQKVFTSIGISDRMIHLDSDGQFSKIEINFQERSSTIQYEYFGDRLSGIAVYNEAGLIMQEVEYAFLDRKDESAYNRERFYFGIYWQLNGQVDADLRYFVSDYYMIKQLTIDHAEGSRTVQELTYEFDDTDRIISQSLKGTVDGKTAYTSLTSYQYR